MICGLFWWFGPIKDRPNETHFQLNLKFKVNVEFKVTAELALQNPTPPGAVSS